MDSNKNVTLGYFNCSVCLWLTVLKLGLVYLNNIMDPSKFKLTKGYYH